MEALGLGARTPLGVRGGVAAAGGVPDADAGETAFPPGGGTEAAHSGPRRPGRSPELPRRPWLFSGDLRRHGPSRTLSPQAAPLRAFPPRQGPRLPSPPPCAWRK